MTNPYQKPTSNLNVNNKINNSDYLIWFKRTSNFLLWAGGLLCFTGFILITGYLQNISQKYTNITQFEQWLSLTIGAIALIISYGLIKKPLLFLLPSIVIAVIIIFHVYILFGIQAPALWLSFASIITAVIAFYKYKKTKNIIPIL